MKKYFLAAVLFSAAFLPPFLISCGKKTVMPFSPLITQTFTASPTDTPVFSPTNTPTATPTLTVSPTATETLNTLFTPTFTVTPTVTPDFAFGGLDADYAYSIAASPDGGFLMAGQTRSFGAGGSDILLYKISASGAYEWHAVHGGTDNDGAYSVIPSASGGYIVAGFTQSSGSGLADAYIMKTDAFGGKIWERTVGGADYDFAEDVLETADGSIYAAGAYRSGNYNALLFKLDASGSPVWSYTYGGTQLEMAHSLCENYTGGFIIAGEYNSFTSSYHYIASVNSAGILEWSKNGTTLYSRIYCIRKDPDGVNFIAAGEESVTGSNYNMMLAKFDPLGNIIWKTFFGGTAYDTGKSVIPLPDGYIITGETASFGGGSQFYVVRTDLNGALLWQRSYGGADFDTAYDITQAAGGYVLCGRTFSFGFGSPGDLYYIKIDASGAPVW